MSKLEGNDQTLEDINANFSIIGEDIKILAGALDAILAGNDQTLENINANFSIIGEDIKILAVALDTINAKLVMIDQIYDEIQRCRDDIQDFKNRMNV